MKCAKTGYALDPATIRSCSELLERELALFPAATALLLMGDVADPRRSTRSPGGRASHVPFPPARRTGSAAGSITSAGIRVFPSYLQAGPSFYIEKQKRRMIAEDIASAMRHAGLPLPRVPSQPAS